MLSVVVENDELQDRVTKRFRGRNGPDQVSGPFALWPRSSGELAAKEKREGCCLPAWFPGAPSWTLTSGLPLRRRSLYTTELWGRDNTF